MRIVEPVKLSKIIDLRVEQIREDCVKLGHDPSKVNSQDDRHYLLGGLEDVVRGLGIPVVEFDDANPDSIAPSQEVVEQMVGQIFKIGMSVRFNMAEWVLIGGDFIDGNGEIWEGDVISESTTFEQLCFAPLKYIDVDS